MGLAAPLGEMGFDGAKPTCQPTPRYAAVVPSDYKGGEKRLVLAALMETCTTKPDKTPRVAKYDVRNPTQSQFFSQKFRTCGL